MKILFLTNKSNTEINQYSEILQKYNSDDKIDFYFEKIDEKKFLNEKYDLIMKDRYHFELNDFLFSNNLRFINFHPSYLPNNMKSDSNLWSIIDETKKGSSIIEMKDKNWEKYNIICQNEIFLNEEDTLKSSFKKCIDLFPILLKLNWEKIRNNSYKRNYYSIKDGKIYYGNEKGDFLETLQKKYDTLVKDIPELWKKYKKF